MNVSVPVYKYKYICANNGSTRIYGKCFCGDSEHDTLSIFEIDGKRVAGSYLHEKEIVLVEQQETQSKGLGLVDGRVWRGHQSGTLGQRLSGLMTVMSVSGSGPDRTIISIKSGKRRNNVLSV